MTEEIIQFIGLNDLEMPEQALVNKLATSYHEKIRRQLSNMTSLVVHIKIHKKTGTHHKYSLHARALAPSKMFESTATDWDLAKALHKVFIEMEREIQHKLKTDSQHHKSYER